MQEIIERIRRSYESLGEFREMRARCKRYTYGRQWDDPVCYEGRTMRESEYIRLQGSVPMKNNLIRRLVRNVVGVFRNRYAFPAADRLGLDKEKAADAAIYASLLEMADANRLPELFARTMEEFLISGMAVVRLTPDAAIPGPAGRAPVGTTRYDYVAPDAFFVDAKARDFRGWDATLVGEIHDIDLPSLIGVFARTPQDVKRLESLYPEAARQPGGQAARCRVYEVWWLDTPQRYRVHDPESGQLYKMERADYEKLPRRERRRLDARWFVDRHWRYAFLTPEGDVLAEGDSPLPDGGHPYIWKGYPFIDGEIHSFVDDVIDQQRFTNRLITMYDWILRSSAKGVLLFPQEAVPAGSDIDDIIDEWSRFNGVIMYRSKGGTQPPHQVSGTASQNGITDLLNIQMKMFEDVSGVNSAMQGKLESGSTSGTLYDIQMRQAMVSLQDILDTFDDFLRSVALRALALR